MLPIAKSYVYIRVLWCTMLYYLQLTTYWACAELCSCSKMNTLKEVFMGCMFEVWDISAIYRHETDMFYAQRSIFEKKQVTMWSLRVDCVITFLLLQATLVSTISQCLCSNVDIWRLILLSGFNRAKYTTILLSETFYKRYVILWNQCLHFNYNASIAYVCFLAFWGAMG